VGARFNVAPLLSFSAAVRSEESRRRTEGTGFFPSPLLRTGALSGGEYTLLGGFWAGSGPDYYGYLPVILRQ